MYTDIVVGGQFGSEAKGHVAAQIVLAGLQKGKTHTLVRVAGPNAGHSAVDPKNGSKWALRQIPVAAIIDHGATIVLAAGSEIDMEVLIDEVTRLDAAGYRVSDRLIVSDEATVLEPHHKKQETGMHERLGSTGKGIGAARAERLMRKAKTVGDLSDFPFMHGSDDWVRKHYRRHRALLIEGTQGFGLGLHAGFYPYCTSSDCRAIDFMAMSGVNPGEAPVRVWMVCRTYPIRVAGESGPLEFETTWEALSAQTDGYIQPERTTVTQLIRRVGGFSPELVRRAWVANGGGRQSTDWVVHPVLSFADYLDPECAGATDSLTFKAQRQADEYARMIGAGFQWSGYTTSDRTIIWNDRP